MNPSAFSFQLRNYLNLSFRMNRLPYLIFIIAHAVIIMPYLIESMPPPDAIPETSVYRDDISARLFHFFYNMLLIPAHIKRMKDIGFTWKLIEATLYIFYVPSLLVILLSDGGFLALNNILLLVGLVEITLSLYLLVKEGDIGKNMHGKDPLKERK